MNFRDYYNLNIPRYVDTFEAEEYTDLSQMAAELKVLDLEGKDTDLIIADFCKQLGIDTSF